MMIISHTAQRYALRRNAETRGAVRGIEDTEPCRDNSTDSGLEDEDSNIMRLVAAGGLWTGNHAQKAGYEDTPTCKLCGQDTPTMARSIQAHVSGSAKHEDFRK